MVVPGLVGMHWVADRLQAGALQVDRSRPVDPEGDRSREEEREDQTSRNKQGGNAIVYKMQPLQG